MLWIIIVLAAVLLIYLFLIFPSARKHPHKNRYRNLFVAHRGLHNIKKGVPENSLAAFKSAIENGFALEIDIHVTKDNKIVIFHDDDLKRVCNNEGVVEQMTFDELSDFNLLGTDYKIPLLEELLEICDENSLLVIEYKCGPKNYKRLCENADKVLSSYNVPYIMQSFNPLALMWYKNNRKDIFRGQLASNFFKEGRKNLVEIICGFLLLNFLSRPDFISYDIKYPNTLSRRIAVGFGATSAGWTITSQKQLDNCKNDNNIYIFENFIPIKK